MHDRKRAGGRDAVGEHRPVQAAGDCEDGGQHDDEPGVEEDGKAQHEGGDTQRQGRFVLAEFPHEGIGKRLRAPGLFDQAAGHCA